MFKNYKPFFRLKKDGWFRVFIRRNKKYAPLLFFLGGFIFDLLTLGRIDRLYDSITLCVYLSSLSICLYLYNLADDGKWKGTFIERFEEFLPLAIQFFLGGLLSANVIYFSRSVSLTKTVSFFIILVLLFIANEFLKKRISNKYLQFSVYFFVNFTFFTFFIPVIVKEMNATIFMVSGLISLATTLFLIIYIYAVSPSTRAEIKKGKMLAIVIGVYLLINIFYYFKLIPPVPLALEKGIVAHNIEKENDKYIVTFQADDWYVFWRDSSPKFIYNPGETVYIYSSIFAPTDLKKNISHRWKKYNSENKEWEILDIISFDITGGRKEGYRGYSFKNNVDFGEWKVDVITEEELVLGVIRFEIRKQKLSDKRNFIKRIF